MYPNLKQPTFIELFCGSATITKAFKRAGYITFCTDNRKRKGTCEPDLKIDILKLTSSLIPFKRPDIIYAGLPCTAFSYSAGDFYFKNNNPKKSAQHYISILDKTIKILTQLSPKYYFIENPRGHLRYFKTMIDFLINTNGCIKQTTLGSYGFPTTKPTDIFTNALDLNLRDKLPYGRGAKNLSGSLDNLTVCQKQKAPRAFAQELVDFCDSKLFRTSYPC